MIIFTAVNVHDNFYKSISINYDGKSFKNTKKVEQKFRRDTTKNTLTPNSDLIDKDHLFCQKYF